MNYESKNAVLDAMISPLPSPRYTIDASFIYIEHQLDGYANVWGGLNLDPDFQRGHVWTNEQRVAFVEGIFRGTVGDSQRIIQFNAPHWDDENHGGDLKNEIQIVDGLQRLTTVRMFMAGEVEVFGGLKASDLDGSRYAVNRPNYRLQFAMHNFANRADLLRYYISINSGGTPHSQSEIERVRKLLEDVSR